MLTLALTCLLTAAPASVSADAPPSAQSGVWSAEVGSFQGINSFDLTHAYPLNYFLAGFYARGGVLLSDRLSLELETSLSTCLFETIVREAAFSAVALDDHFTVALGASLAHSMSSFPNAVADNTSQVDDVAAVARLDFHLATDTSPTGRRRGLAVGLQAEAGSSLPAGGHQGAFGFGVFVTVGARWW